ncbi:hypothetical protein CKY47_15855 [Saccharothrix yanglingensis]|uniref:Uncharacterized protein n=1 Tax=Saccharothrix yanglingensis TaxID=659496 RepID=A0ABU0WZX6_9PSEU|nr:hypothetical protein [Saccharothrix yanglingensis]
MVGAREDAHGQGRAGQPVGVGRGGGEEVRAAGDRHHRVRAAEHRQERAAQGHHVGRGVVVLLAAQEAPEAFVHALRVGGDGRRQPRGADQAVASAKSAPCLPASTRRSWRSSAAVTSSGDRSRRSSFSRP